MGKGFGVGDFSLDPGFFVGDDRQAGITGAAIGGKVLGGAGSYGFLVAS